MEIKEFTFTGFIEIDYSDDFRTILLKDEDKSVDLVKKFRAIFDLYESEVSVSYYISNDKKAESEIQQGWLTQLFGGITAEYKTSSYHYSTYTYGTDYDTYLKIGGHDLFDEFYNYTNKYCVIKITIKTT